MLFVARFFNLQQLFFYLQQLFNLQHAPCGSLYQGGPAPCFLSKEAFCYVVDGIDSVSTED